MATDEYAEHNDFDHEWAEFGPEFENQADVFRKKLEGAGDWRKSDVPQEIPLTEPNGDEIVIHREVGYGGGPAKYRVRFTEFGRNNDQPFDRITTVELDRQDKISVREEVSVSAELLEGMPDQIGKRLMSRGRFHNYGMQRPTRYPVKRSPKPTVLETSGFITRVYYAEVAPAE